MGKSRKEVKDFLQRYLYLKAEARATEEELARLRSRLDLKSPALTGMPKGSKAYTLEDYVADADGTIDYLLTCIADLNIAEREIREAIQEVPDSLLRTLLINRYILGQSLAEIADGLHYSYSRVRVLHLNALDAAGEVLDKRQCAEARARALL